MRSIVQFVKATVVGGVVVILPIVLGILVVLQAIQLLHRVVDPVAGALGFRQTVLATVATVILLVLACFLFGLAMRTAAGMAARDVVERWVLNRVPGYSELRAVARSLAGIESKQYGAALVDLAGSDCWSLALIVEQAGDRTTVYVPVAPAVTLGFVHVVPTTRVRPMDGGIGEVFRVARQFGRGTLDMKPPQAAPVTDRVPPASPA